MPVQASDILDAMQTLQPIIQGLIPQRQAVTPIAMNPALGMAIPIPAQLELQKQFTAAQQANAEAQARQQALGQQQAAEQARLAMAQRQMQMEGVSQGLQQQNLLSEISARRAAQEDRAWDRRQPLVLNTGQGVVVIPRESLPTAGQALGGQRVGSIIPGTEPPPDIIAIETIENGQRVHKMVPKQMDASYPVPPPERAPKEPPQDQLQLRVVKDPATGEERYEVMNLTQMAREKKTVPTVSATTAKAPDKITTRQAELLAGVFGVTDSHSQEQIEAIDVGELAKLNEWAVWSIANNVPAARTVEMIKETQRQSAQAQPVEQGPTAQGQKAINAIWNAATQTWEFPK